MKHVKMLGPLSLVVVFSLVFAVSASATTVRGPSTDTAGNPTTQAQFETPAIHAVSEDSPFTTGNHVLLHNNIADIECESTTEGTVTQHGSGVTALGFLNALSFTGCTGGWSVTVEDEGSLEVHYKEARSTHNVGTVTSSGATVVAHRFGVTCNYKTENTHVGTITGGNPATLHIEALIPFHGGSFLCGSQASNWTGSYVTTHTVKIEP